jgi:hypothetical protein
MLIRKLPGASMTAKPSTAYPLDYVVWLIDGLFCPRCGRELRATDIDLDRLSETLICRGCHADIARVERR